MTNDLQAILAHGATWLGWNNERWTYPSRDYWETPNGRPQKLEYLVTGNGMLLAFEKMRTEKEEVRDRFDGALMDWLVAEHTYIDDLYPELVWRAVYEATKHE